MKSILQIFLITGLLFLQSCKKDSNDNFNQDYFYYTYNYEKIPLYLLGTQVYIEFNVAHSTQEISNLQNKYTFFTKDPVPDVLIGYKRIKININAADTLQLLSFLKQLNQDTSISYAVPVFTSIKNDPMAFVIPTNQIVCDPLIANDQISVLISQYDLTVIKSKPDNPYYLLKVNKIVTGFETLDISNALYRTNKFNYVTPNFYASIAPS